MRYRIFSCQSPKAHRKGKTHRPRDSIDSTCEIKSTIRPEDIGKKEGGSSNGQAQILLTALHNLIVPLVQNVVPDTSDMAAGPEAELLLAALQNYIARIIGGRGQSGRVSWASTRIVHLRDLDAPDVRDILGTEEISKGVKDELESTELTKNSLIGHHNLTCDRNGQLNALLEELRERVSNELPIRLLYFDKPDDTMDLKISLLSRSEIYAILVGTITSKYMTMAWDDISRWSLVQEATRYAILSHTWLHSDPGELIYEDWRSGLCDLKHPGYQKLVHFCKAALQYHNVTFGWMDTVCIDKSSSSELDESIRLMYKWYENSSICITYLAHSTSVCDMADDLWFTRGWTLQELIAPRVLKFYNRDWNQLNNSENDKEDKVILERILMATGIKETELLSRRLGGLPISRRMQWAAKRKVTRNEDSVYSLMGIFAVSIPIAYGEGASQAFGRLLKEILGTTVHCVLDIFNWVGQYESYLTSILPPSPQYYLQRDEDLSRRLPSRVMEPLTLTHMGLRVPTLILPTTLTSPQVAEYTPKGDFFSTATTKHAEGVVLPLALRKNVSLILDVKAFDPAITIESDRYALAVLNCTGDESDIEVPVYCFAIAIRYASDVVTLKSLSLKTRIPSIHPITFQLQGDPTVRADIRAIYSLRRMDLERHGMQFLYMYF